MADGAENGSCKIKAQVPDVAKPVVYVISEHIQKVHISEDMADTAVQKCVSYELPQEWVCRREHIVVCPLVQALPAADIGYEKNEHIDDNQCVIRVWRAPRPNTCPDWKQHILIFVKNISKNCLESGILMSAGILYKE